MTINPLWKSETIMARIRDLAAQGLSAADIAGAIGGVSRNSVIGLLRRKGIALTGANANKSRAAKSVHQQKKVRATRNRPFAPKFDVPPQVIEALPTTSADDLAIPRDRLKTLLELETGMCKWPIGESSPFLFCAAPALDNRPYCPSHSRRAYNPSAYRNALRGTGR